MTDTAAVARLAITLMEIESTSGNEGAVIARADELLASRGWSTVRIPVTPGAALETRTPHDGAPQPSIAPGRDALLAVAGESPVVTLSTHLDTVPPFIPPRLDGDTLHGRGACDAKGIAASMILAAERLRDRGVGVALLFVVGEETTHDGAHAANAWPNTSRVLINGEPTESTLAVGTKGAMRAVIRIRGRAAHSAYPELGRSATEALVRLLAELPAVEWPSDPVLGHTTVNIGRLEGGIADNVIAPAAEARLMLRLVGSEDETWERLRAWVGDRGEVERGITVPPVHLGTLDGFPTSVAAYATDIPALTNWGTPYLFGPGSIHVAHTLDEQVSVRELADAVTSYERIAIGALARDAERHGGASAGASGARVTSA